MEGRWVDNNTELQEARKINEEHRILNGELREQIKSLEAKYEQTVYDFAHCMKELEMALNIIHAWSEPITD